MRLVTFLLAALSLHAAGPFLTEPYLQLGDARGLEKSETMARAVAYGGRIVGLDCRSEIGSDVEDGSVVEEDGGAVGPARGGGRNRSAYRVASDADGPRSGVGVRIPGFARRQSCVFIAWTRAKGSRAELPFRRLRRLRRGNRRRKADGRARAKTESGFCVYSRRHCLHARASLGISHQLFRITLRLPRTRCLWRPREITTRWAGI